MDLGFDVVAITGDHSTPAALKGHSFHPNPLMIISSTVRQDRQDRFTERNASKGSLGIIAF